MNWLRSILPAVLLLVMATSPAHARAIDIDDADAGGAAVDDLPPYLQCVPYARQVSGIRIYGDAHTWWDQAEGRYATRLTWRQLGQFRDATVEFTMSSEADIPLLAEIDVELA